MKTMKRFAVVLSDGDAVMGFKTERAARKFIADRLARGWKLPGAQILSYFEVVS